MTSDATYYVDEAGDGVLFGSMGRDRLLDPGASRFFMLGMVRFQSDEACAAALDQLRSSLMAQPLYASIPSFQPDAGKTARQFHAKDDHPEIRSKVFELLMTLGFKFYCVWALQRCYERQEARFLHALWPKVSLIHDVDDPQAPGLGSHLSRKGPPPDPQKIKSRWI